MKNPLVRQMQIDLITDVHNPIVEWFNDIWSKLYVIEINVYNDSSELIYYIDNNVIDNKPKHWIFYQDKKDNSFWCNYDHYWSILKTKSNLTYTDIQYITKFLVENALNNSIATPGFVLSSNKLNNALNNTNNVIPKPTFEITKNVIKVENALNDITNLK